MEGLCIAAFSAWNIESCHEKTFTLFDIRLVTHSLE